ncbi:MAG: hypothetical protein HY690_14695 [Chloroflexi bacterium]|nr:hypothetical protein [Chloroflexota bacterium]
MRHTGMHGGWWLKATSLALALLALAAPGAAFAQTTAEPTTISVALPATAELGQLVTLQARLLDGSGQPLARAAVLFTSPSSFLNVSGDAVVGRAMTDEQGLAVATFEVRSAGQIAIQAEFRGSARLAPARGEATMAVGEAARQLYVQQAGVRVPGLNAPPAVGPLAMMDEASIPSPLAALYALWPSMSGWPIAAVLLTIWSLYVFVVALLFRVARAGGEVRAPAQLRWSSQSGAAAGTAEASPGGNRWSQEVQSQGGGR